MSQQPISLSPDLSQLRSEGYNLRIKAGHLLVEGVPYVTTSRAIAYGTLVSELTLAGDRAAAPSTHVSYFIGGTPCSADGIALQKIINSSVDQQLAPELTVNLTFSSKPKSGSYTNYHEKITTYIAILAHQAQALDPTVTATTFWPVASEPEDNTPFLYMETASSRAGIAMVTQKLRRNRVAIIGLGGTGSYVLDLIAKCPIDEIHLFDADWFLTHNAFRAPGAPSLDELRCQEKKVHRFASVYSRMHKGIIAHDIYIKPDSINELDQMEFVFICIDSNEDKVKIIERLQARGIPFIDVGMGIQIQDSQLYGIVRVTTSTATMHDHVLSNNRIPLNPTGIDDEYSKNIQIADMNALNATLAVIKWKKLAGFYVDLEREHHSLYTIDGNDLVNEDCEVA